MENKEAEDKDKILEQDDQDKIIEEIVDEIVDGNNEQIAEEKPAECDNE